jgi:acyl-CoA-binding protein
MLQLWFFIWHCKQELKQTAKANAKQQYHILIDELVSEMRLIGLISK